MNKRELIATAAIVAASSGFVAVLGLARTKVFAVALGPSFVGTLGVLSSFLVLSGLAGTLGAGSGSIRYLSSLRDEAEARSARYSISIGGLLASVLLSVGIFLASNTISGQLFGSPTMGSAVRWAAVGVLGQSIVALQSGVYGGLGQQRLYARLNLGGTALGSALAVAAALIAGAPAIGLIAIAVPVATALLLGAGSLGMKRSERRPTLHFRHYRNVLLGSYPYMAAAIAQHGAFLTVRASMLGLLGGTSAGLFHAGYLVCTNLVQFIATSTSQALLRRAVLENSETGRAGVAREHFELVSCILLIIVPGLLVTTPLLIRVLFSAKFTPAVDIVRWMVLGETYGVIATGLLGLLWAGNRLLIAGTLEILSWASLVAVAIALLPGFGMAGVGFAYAASRLVALAGGLMAFPRDIRSARPGVVRLSAPTLVVPTVIFLMEMEGSLVAQVAAVILAFGTAGWAGYRLFKQFDH